MSPVNPPIPDPDEQKVRVLEQAICELRRLYDNIRHVYDQVRVKALALIAGEVAILTLILANPYPFPSNYYVRLLLALGVIGLAFAFCTCLWIVSTVNWKFTHDFMPTHKLQQKFPTELAFLEYLNDDYIEALTHNHPIVQLRAKRINWAVYTLAAGVTIILIVKFGG